MDRSRNPTARSSLLRGMGERLLALVFESAPRDQLSNWLRVPLEHAAARGDFGCVEKLVSAGADVCVRRRTMVVTDRSPLVAACQGGSEEVVSILLRNGAGPNGEFRQRQQHHQQCNTDGCSTCCCSERSNSNSRSSTSSWESRTTGSGHDWGVRGGSSGGSVYDDSCSDDDSSTRWSPLHCAASGGHVAAVKALVSAGGELDAVDDENCTALHLAVFRGHEGVVDVLVAAGAKIDTHDNEGETPLHTAAGSGNLNMVRALLRACPPGVINGNGGVHLLLSPLHRAALGGHSDVMRELLAHGASAATLSCGGRSILHACAMSGSGEAVRVLLEKEAGLEATDDEGCTATHIAAGHRLGSVATLDAFLLAGANMEATTNNGETPLHRACQALRVDSVKLLLQFGADEDARDGDGRTPAAVASKLLQTQEPGVYRNRLDEILNMLAKAPADRVWRRRGWLVMMRVQHQRRESCFAAIASASAAPPDGRRKQRRHAPKGVLVNLPRFLGHGSHGQAEEEQSEQAQVPTRFAPAQLEHDKFKNHGRPGGTHVQQQQQQQRVATVERGGVMGEWDGQGGGIGGAESKGGMAIHEGNFEEGREGRGLNCPREEGGGEEFRSAVQMAVGVEESGVFRTILGFL